MPDLDNGGSLMMSVQNMLIQNVNEKILILPAFPSGWTVDYKLHAFDNTIVRVISGKTGISTMDVFPASRMKDVVLPD